VTAGGDDVFLPQVFFYTSCLGGGDDDAAQRLPRHRRLWTKRLGAGVDNTACQRWPCSGRSLGERAGASAAVTGTRHCPADAISDTHGHTFTPKTPSSSHPRRPPRVANRRLQSGTTDAAREPRRDGARRS